MKRSRFSEEQVSRVLREAEAGVPVADLCRKLGVSEATFYVWKKKYGELTTSELRKMRQLDGSNFTVGRVGSIVGPKLGGALKAAGHSSVQLFADIFPLVVLASVTGLWFAWQASRAEARRPTQE